MIFHFAGFVFVEFKDNRSACEAKRQCLGDRKYLFGRPIKNVDWAIIKEEYSEDDMSKVSNDIYSIFLRVRK